MGGSLVGMLRGNSTLGNSHVFVGQTAQPNRFLQAARSFSLFARAFAPFEIIERFALAQLPRAPLAEVVP
jgi:hypothetical protein